MMLTETEISDALAVQDFIASQYPPPEETVSSTVRMGRALVSGALGMRTDDPKYFETAVKMPECKVVIQSTRRKAKAPVSAPPPNSIESDRDLNESGDLQLSQSANNVGVYVELPGAVVAAVNVGLCAQEIVDNLSDVVTTDTSRTPAIAPALEELPLKESPQGVEDSQPDAREGHDGSKERGVSIVGAREIGVVERRRILSEIEKAKLLRDEMIRQDQSLVNVAAFVRTVCGGPTEKEMGKVGKTDQKQTTEQKVETILSPSQTRMEEEHVERQRLTRIAAEKSLLEEDINKTRPSLESVTTSCVAAYGEDKTPESLSAEESLTAGDETGTLIDDLSIRALGNRTAEMSEDTSPAAVATAVVESEIVQATEVRIECSAEAEVIVSDDAAMSVGDSDEEGESDGFSRTGSSSHGDSIPNGKVTETIRKEFPGLVSRSEAGCRIYIPASERAGAMEVISKLMTATIAVRELGEIEMTDATNATD